MPNTIQNLLLVLLLSMGLSAQAAKVIGNPDAPVGGNFRINMGAEPSGLNPLKGSDGYASEVTGYIFDSLLTRNPDTFELEPALAEKYEIAKDGMSITFWLREGATFHDGSPVTVEDVKFSFDVSNDPELSDAVRKLYFENFERAEIVGKNAIKYIIKKKYFKNLEVAGGFEILPKAIYSDKTKKMNKTAVGSGPYKLENYTQGQKIVLKRNDNWWGFKVPLFKGYYKFDRITYSFIKDLTVQLESLKKGELDYLALTPEYYMKKTDGPMWGNTVLKQAVENKSAKGYSFMAFNLKRPIFQDAKVREAMSLLLNRDMMIEKFFYGKYMPASGPWYAQSPYADPNTKADKYDPTTARELLKSAGWVDSNKDGVLDKMIDGKLTNFSITIIHPGAGGEWEKYLTVYKEELKKSGIDFQLKQLEWNAFQKTLNERNFDMVGLAWGGVIELDPKQIWHSASMTAEGSNFAGYSNPKVDQLIDKAREELNKEKRTKLLRQIYAEVAKDRPYIFMFVPKFGFYAHSSKVQMLKPTFTYSVGRDTWWFKQ